MKTLTLRGALSALALIVVAGTVNAQTITVNELNDELVTDGDCSLREAIIAANTDTAQDACPAGNGTDTIILPAGTIWVSFPGLRNEDAAMSGDLDILQSVIIQGQGAGATIIDGSAATGMGDGLFDVRSTNNTISGVTMKNIEPSLGWNGAIFVQNGASLIMNASEILDGASVSSSAGAIWVNGSMDIYDSTISGNQSEFSGGAIYVNFGSLGIYSTLIYNNSAYEAGGIYANNANVTVRNSTISGNQSSSGASGMTIKDFGASNVSFIHSTVNGNSIANDGSAASFVGTIVSGGVGGNVASSGYNLVDSGSGFTGPGDQTGANAQLQALANNGGPTYTHAILASSPAHNTRASCGISIDQRGYSRGDGMCDSGAFEVGGTLPVELTSLQVTVNGTAAVLAWRTESETNNAGFDVEQQGADERWERLDFVTGQGTSSLPHEYAFRINSLNPGQNRFRLRQLDYDGTFTYSKTVEVYSAVTNAHFLSDAYPNPFETSTRLDFVVDRSQHVTATLHDLLGREIRVLFSGVVERDGRPALVVNGADLAAGTYFVRVEGENFVSVKTITANR